MSSEILVKVEHLSRHYGPIVAVNSISFEVKRGEVLGFLGPNGAGKTSTMQMLTGNLAPSTGKVEICGIDLLDKPKQAKAQIGYLPEQPPLDRELTVEEFLRFCARINRMPRDKITSAMNTAMERCGLTNVSHRLIKNLSKGYQQRVGIAQAIIHTPAVIILDEPTVGLDPIQIREIRNLIRELGKEHAVILSTHILTEVQMTCDHVQIITKGRLVYNDSLQNLNKKSLSSSIVLGLRTPPDINALQNLPQVNHVEAIDANHWRLSHDAESHPAEAIAKLAVERNWGLMQLTPEFKTLEQIFVDITSSEMSHVVELNKEENKEHAA